MQTLSFKDKYVIILNMFGFLFPYRLLKDKDQQIIEGKKFKIDLKNSNHQLEIKNSQLFEYESRFEEKTQINQQQLMAKDM